MANKNATTVAGICTLLIGMGLNIPIIRIIGVAMIAYALFWAEDTKKVSHKKQNKKTSNRTHSQKA